MRVALWNSIVYQQLQNSIFQRTKIKFDIFVPFLPVTIFTVFSISSFTLSKDNRIENRFTEKLISILVSNSFDITSSRMSKMNSCL